MEEVRNEFMNETSFQLQIEKMVKEEGLNYLEAVLAFCDDNDIEPESIKKLITTNLKGKLKLSAIESGYFKPESTLPL